MRRIQMMDEQRYSEHEVVAYCLCRPRTGRQPENEKYASSRRRDQWMGCCPTMPGIRGPGGKERQQVVCDCLQRLSLPDGVHCCSNSVYGDNGRDV